ncbi:MAG: ABC transporter permease [Candidatus Aminicenantes bacterium]|nr:ABC transporter permease [Candidatus Aminicenantes bacterium]
MRFLAYLSKTFKENLREWKILILALVFAPIFVYFMFAYFGATSPSYALLVLNRDQPAPTTEGKERRAGEDLVAEWTKLKYPDGKPIFKVRPLDDLEEGRRLIKNHDADLVVIIPDGFSRSIEGYRQKRTAAVSPLTNIGDTASVRFMVAASLADFVSFSYVTSAAGLEIPEVVKFETVGAIRNPSEFDLYVPALLVLAIIMVLFTAAASIIKEVDKGTIVRLQLSRLTPFEFLSAVSFNQLLIGTAAVGLTYLAALSVGYQSDGSAVMFLLVAALGTLSIIAIGLLVAAWMKTIYELLTVGVFPFFILMFFSEMFPLPRVTLFRLAGHVFYANDVLPTALTVKALNKVLNFRAGPADVVFELAAIVVLTVLYFAAGLWLFHRRHLRAR